MQEQEKDAEIKSLCRLCGLHKFTVVKIFGETGEDTCLASYIKQYLPLNAAFGDGLPSLCCWSCANVLMSFHKLHVTSVETDKRLRGIKPPEDVKKESVLEEIVPEEEFKIVRFEEEQVQEDDKDEDSNKEFKFLKDPESILAECKESDATYQCKFCRKKYEPEQSELMLKHYLNHVINSKCRCKHCPKMFTNDTACKRHMDSVHLRLRKWQCSDCKKNYTSKSALDQHRTIHTGIKPFSCPICKERFQYRKSLAGHKKKVHLLDMGNNIACMDCGQHFETRSLLTEHKKQVHFLKYRKGNPENPKQETNSFSTHECTKCNNIFVTKQQLQEHVQQCTQTNVENFTMDIPDYVQIKRAEDFIST